MRGRRTAPLLALALLALHAGASGPPLAQPGVAVAGVGPPPPLDAPPSIGARESPAPPPEEGPLVCVLDTGVDAAHVDLDGGKVAAWADFIHGRALPYDDNGHGTHVAATAAGAGEADPRHPGAAPHARLAVGKVMDERGRGTSGAAAKGIAWCLEQGAQVISLSLEEDACEGRHGLAEAVARALARDVPVVTSAGNRGAAPCAIHTPGSLAQAFTVGALAGPTPDAGRVAAFSGRNDREGIVKPDVVAPGQGIRAAAAGTRDQLQARSGTSMATPHVAGVIAVLRAAFPDAPAADVLHALRATARDGGEPGPDAAWGWGAVDAARARAWLAARA